MNAEVGGNTVEIESTLVIQEGDRTAVTDRLRAVDTIGNYLIGEPAGYEINDLYVDTPDSVLGSRGYVLRLRRSREQRLLTLKGPSVTMRGGARKRFELEAAWSEEHCRAIERELDRAGIGVMAVYHDPERGEPFEGGIQDGWQVIHRRTTSRSAREIPEAAGEMAIDTVHYDVGGRGVRHFEVEIECRGEDAGETAARIAGSLRKMFGDKMRPWQHGKLATCRLIEEVARRNLLDALLDADGLMDRAAYDLLHRISGET